MGLFGLREPCPHCGKKVRKPGNPGNFLCPHCDKPGPWASPEQVSDWEGGEAEHQQLERLQTEARQRYSEALAALASGAPTDATQLPTFASQAGFSAEEIAAMKTEAFAAYVRQAVGDEILTPEEEAHVQELVRCSGSISGGSCWATPTSVVM